MPHAEKVLGHPPVPRRIGVSYGRSPGFRIVRSRAPSRTCNRLLDLSRPVGLRPMRPRLQWRGPRGIFTRFP